MTQNFLLAQCARVRVPARLSWAMLALAGAGFAQTSLAQTAPASADKATLPTTVVTATRSESPLDDTLADVRVITQEQIEGAAGRSLAEVLQRFAGAQLTSNGGRGQVQAISLRGSKQVIVLLDGMRFGSITTGEAALQSIPLEIIERIEVVHGPASALYGSDALGGVIQIFTKQGKGVARAFAPHAAANVGSAGYKDATAGFAGAQGGWNYSLNLARVVDPGISATNAKNSYSFHPDDDKFNQTSFNAALGYAINADWRIDTSVLQAESRAEFDNGATQLSWVDGTALSAQAKLSGRVSEHWKTHLRIAQTQDKQWTYDLSNSTGVRASSLYETTQTETSWGNEVRTPVGTLNAGLEHLVQDVRASTAYDVTDRTTNAAYAGLNGAHGAHSWQVNLRNDDNSQFGNFTTWGLAYGYQVLPSLRVHASRGKSIKAPTFNDLYWPRSGNPLLQPEEGRNTEVGLHWSHQGHDVRLTRFDNKVSNLIAWAPNATGAWLPANIDRARMRGWSLGYSTAVAGFNIAANYEHLDAFDEGKGTRAFGRLAEHQGTLSVDKRFGDWTVGANALLVGARKESASVSLPGYGTLDVQAQYQVNRDWSVVARVSNLFDKQYETANGYNQRGRAAYIGMKWALR